MRLTCIGTGDAFGSGGRFNTCFLVESGECALALDFGASSLVAMKRLKLHPNHLDGVMLSHLHGDHFGGLPFLMLDYQFACARTRPFTVIGPVGTQERLEAAMEVFFPGSPRNAWRFGFEVVDLPCQIPHRFGPFTIETHEVVHPSGAPATGVRIADGRKCLAYSGDTAWTPALLDVARGADLFISECFRLADPPPNHLALSVLDAHRSELETDRIMLTHMSDEVLAAADAVAARGYLIAHDGLVLDV